MKVAVSIYNGRIAPVFDVSNSSLIIQLEKNQWQEQETVELPMGPAFKKIAFLADWGVECLICGAITRSAYCIAESYDMQVHGFVAGAVEDVITAFAEGTLAQKEFDMPGCGRQRRRRCHFHKNC